MELIPDALYRELFAKAPIGIAISDEQGYITAANDYLLEGSGYTMEDLRGKMASDLYYDGATYRHEIIEKVRTLGHLDNFELRFKRKDGSPFWARMSLRPFVLDGRRFMAALIEDVNELHDTKRVFSIAVKAGRIGVWFSEPSQEGKLVWSDEAHEIFGFDKGTFDGRVETFFRRVHPEDLDMVTQASQDALAGKKRYDVEHRIIRKNDGAVRWVHQEAEVAFGADGKATQMIGVARDITDEKALAAEREGHAAELEHFIRSLVGRENKMAELKRRLHTLEDELGRPRSKDE